MDAKHLFFDSNSIPEVTKRGKFYRYVWELSGIIVDGTIYKQTIDLDERFRGYSPGLTWGQKIDEYSLLRANTSVGFENKIVDFYSLVNHVLIAGSNPAEYKTSTGVRAGKMIHIGPPNGSDWVTLEWHGCDAMVKTVSNLRYTDNWSRLDYSAAQTYGTDNQTYLGDIYSAPMQIPKGWMIVGGGIGNPHIFDGMRWDFGTGTTPAGVIASLPYGIFDYPSNESGPGVLENTGKAVPANTPPKMDIGFLIPAIANNGSADYRAAVYPENATLQRKYAWLMIYDGEL